MEFDLDEDTKAIECITLVLNLPKYLICIGASHFLNARDTILKNNK